MKALIYLLYMGLGALVLFQGSRLISTGLEKRLLDVPPAVIMHQRQEPAAEMMVREDYDLSLFSSPLFAVPRAEEKPEEESGGAFDSALLRKYELRGTVLMPDNRSLALIRKAGEREDRVYRRGDMLDNLEIVGIERHQVVFSDGMGTSALPMYHRERSASQRFRPQASRKPPAPSDSGSRMVRKVLSRSEVESRVFSRVNQILTQIAISPYMVNGKMEGLRLIRVPNDSIVYELGGRSGDIIRRVNGHQVDQIDQMYKLWENIKDDSLITVDLERKNQMHTYRFEIRE